MPKEVKRGRSSLRLATMSAQTLAERPFEVVGGPIPWPVRLALGAGSLLVGALARIAFRRWRASRDQRSRRRPTELTDDVRVHGLFADMVRAAGRRTAEYDREFS